MCKKISAPVLISVLLFTMGCAKLLTSDTPAARTYLLKPLVSGAGGFGPEGSPELMLDITVAPGLDTDRLLVLEPDARLNHHEAARWQDHLPEVIGSILRRTLQQSALFSSVRYGYAANMESWSLQLEVQEFYSLADASGDITSVRATMGGIVRCDDQQNYLSLTVSEPVSTNRIESVVRAHQLSVDKIQIELMQNITQFCGEE